MPNRGDLVLVPFAYSDLTGRKRRPACVVSSGPYQHGPDVIVAMVTSQRRRIESPGLGDVIVEDWRTAGLLAPSTVRTGRILVIESRLIRGVLGAVDGSTLSEIDAGLRDVFGLA